MTGEYSNGSSNGKGNHAVLPFLTVGVPRPPAPAPAEAEESLVPELAGILSPSQCATWYSCSAKWHYRYNLQLLTDQSSSLAVGKAMHSTVRVNFEQKITTRRDLEVSGLLAVFEEEWAKEAKVTRFQKSESPDELRAMGRALVSNYMEKTAPSIEPAAVELAVKGVIAGVPVRGFVDVLDVHGRIIDLKSAKASPPAGKIRPDYRFQIATYAAITPGASGKARLDTLVKLKTGIRQVATSFEVNDADRQSVETLYPLAQAGMRSGLVYPNRNSFLCSQKYCSYARQCVLDYGGEVL